ncbi:hypothetical protein [Variovorax sp. PDC80]|uniref:hypothetical protein n=1 Tax=Variovorax sp. PDC80 TaxID=1882827 RepID=UPI001160C680|nr:hypothetical protein [Variovorax sp. PDC80]
MATSAIRFGLIYVHVRDSRLGELLKAIAYWMPVEISTDGRNLEWLAHAIGAWCEDYENMPPGLKDVELDQWLSDGAREQTFLQYLRHVASRDAPPNTYDANVVRNEIERVLKVLWPEK